MKNMPNYTRPEELLTKVIIENAELREDIKLLQEELDEDEKEIVKLKSIIRDYEEYYNGNEIEIIPDNRRTNTVEPYINWLNSEGSEEMANAYAAYF